MTEKYLASLRLNDHVTWTDDFGLPCTGIFLGQNSRLIRVKMSDGAEVVVAKELFRPCCAACAIPDLEEGKQCLECLTKPEARHG